MKTYIWAVGVHSGTPITKLRDDYLVWAATRTRFHPESKKAALEELKRRRKEHMLPGKVKIGGSMSAPVHILLHGQALCGAGFPMDWKDGATWIGIMEAIPGNLSKSTCEECLLVHARAEERSVPGDKVAGHLLIGAKGHEVVMNFGGEIERDAEGCFYIKFSPSQARALGRLLHEKATEAERQ